MWNWKDPDEWEDEVLAEDFLIPWLDRLNIYLATETNYQVLKFYCHASLEDILISLPLDYIGTGGEHIQIIGPGYEVYIWMEDWLSGCIPKHLSYGTVESKKYILSAFKRKILSLKGKLGKDWDLVISQDGTLNRASRLVFVRKHNHHS